MKWMMKILDTDSIQLDKDDRFNREAHGVQIEAIAHEIVKLQGLLSVVLVRKVDLENYAIVSGHLEHFWLYLIAPIMGATFAIPVCKYLTDK